MKRDIPSTHQDPSAVTEEPSLIPAAPANLQTHELNKDWRLDIDPANPQGFRVYHASGKFFEVRFNPAKWGQPQVYEKAGADGITGSVIAIVRKHAGIWQVAASWNQRPCDDYLAQQLEGARHSVSNTMPTLAVDPSTVRLFVGHNHVNSARIADKTEIGIVNATGAEEFELPKNAHWYSFAEFFAQSTDVMTKAVLGQFIVEQIGLA